MLIHDVTKRSIFIEKHSLSYFAQTLQTFLSISKTHKCFEFFNLFTQTRYSLIIIESINSAKVFSLRNILNTANRRQQTRQERQSRKDRTENESSRKNQLKSKIRKNYLKKKIQMNHLI